MTTSHEEPRKKAKRRRQKKPTPITSSPPTGKPVQAASVVLQKGSGAATTNEKTLSAGVHLDPIAGGEGQPTVNRDALLKSYRTEVHRLMRQHHRYPPLALRAKLEGIVVVQILISGSGRVLEVTIKNSSGFIPLDRAALRTVKDIAQLPAPPSALNWKKQTLEVPFVYRLRDKKGEYHSRNPAKPTLSI